VAHGTVTQLAAFKDSQSIVESVREEHATQTAKQTEIA